MGRSVIEWLAFTNEEDGGTSVSELRTFGTLVVHTASLAVDVASVWWVLFYISDELDHICRRGAAATVLSRTNLANCRASPSFRLASRRATKPSYRLSSD